MVKNHASRLKYMVHLFFIVIGLIITNLVNRRYDDFYSLLKYAKNSLKQV
ncbi:MAG: hypothetical protein ACQESF_04965 [Nanobdellota archaeon]